MTTKKQWKKEEVISTWKGFKKWHEFPGLAERVRVCRMSPANGYKELPIMIYYVRKTEKAILPSLFGRLLFVSLDRVQATRKSGNHSKLFISTVQSSYCRCINRFG